MDGRNGASAARKFARPPGSASRGRTGSNGGPRAWRVPVPTDEPLIDGDAYDYADAFEIAPRASDPRTPERFARLALEEAPWLLRWTVWLVHRYVIRFRLGPRSSPDHILGWEILRSEPNVVHLEAESPLLRAAIVGRRDDPTCAVTTTYLFYKRPVPARALFWIVGPIHRKVAPYLLERAAASAFRVGSPAAETKGAG